MNTYRRLIGYVAPYWRRVVVLMVIITAFASLSGVSLTLIPPFLRIVFAERAEPAPPAAGARAPARAAEPSGATEPGSARSDAGGEAPGAPGAGPGMVDRPDAGEARPGAVEGIPLPEPVERARERAKLRFEAWLYRGTPSDRLARFCALFVALFLVKNLFGYLQTYFTEYLEQKVLFRIRRDVFAHVQRLPLSYFDRERAGHVISRITSDVSLLRGAVIGVAASVVRNVLMTLIAVFVTLLVSWKLTLLTLVIIPLNIFLVGRIGERLRRRTHRAQEGMADMTASLQETIAGMRVVKAFNMARYELSRFDRFNLRYMKQTLRMKLWAALSSPTSEILGAMSFVAILGYGGRLVIEGRLAAENLVLFVGAMMFVVTPLKNLSKLNNTVQQSLAAAQRVFALLDEPGEPLEAPGRPARFEREIAFEHVDFEYEPGVPVLRDVTFRVRPGEVVAIVGPSGAGKSTLVDLIPRFYEPTGGRITLDGVDLREIQLESLRALMGIVTQETILFNDTILNNIAYGLDEPDREAVEAAARAANAHDFIRAMPRGYDTVIGDRGIQLSGGQRQRIAIARALLRDPRILIFDEATSALDTESEMLVQEAIDRLLSGRTTFVIAHRLSTVQNADRILVLEAGRVTEHGTHAELMARGGAYRRLYDLQFRMASS